MSQATGASRFIPGPLREVLLLEHALRAVESRSPDQVERIRELSAAVDARLVAAEALVAGDQVAPALVILRDAAHLAAQAVLAARGESAIEDPLARVTELVGSGQLGRAPDGFDAAATLVRNPNRLAFDEIPASEAMGRRLEVERAVSWLRGMVEPRTTAQIKRSRVFRVIFACTGVLITVVALLGWGIGKLVSPKNLALGKPVQLSSRRPSCGTASPEGLPGSGLVDGNHSGSYDICTNSEVNPSATIDLGQVHTLTQVKVYNRDDCCWGVYDLPAVVEISVDGAGYTEVGRQSAAYTAAKPWILPIDGKAARYVRVRVDGPQPRELVLTEVEVFGKR
jgi:hypothetical protein